MLAALIAAYLGRYLPMTDASKRFGFRPFPFKD
jgi:hypothetical protein